VKSAGHRSRPSDPRCSWGTRGIAPMHVDRLAIGGSEFSSASAAPKRLLRSSHVRGGFARGRAISGRSEAAQWLNVERVEKSIVSTTQHWLRVGEGSALVLALTTRADSIQLLGPVIIAATSLSPMRTNSVEANAFARGPATVGLDHNPGWRLSVRNVARASSCIRASAVGVSVQGAVTSLKNSLNGPFPARYVPRRCWFLGGRKASVSVRFHARTAAALWISPAVNAMLGSSSCDGSI
jgi:hypothetical protein